MIPTDSILHRVQDVVDRDILPALAVDGGSMCVVGLCGDVLLVRLTGPCKVCPSSSVTLKECVERTILEAIPEIQSVVLEGTLEQGAPQGVRATRVHADSLV